MSYHKSGYENDIYSSSFLNKKGILDQPLLLGFKTLFKKGLKVVRC